MQANITSLADVVTATADGSVPDIRQEFEATVADRGGRLARAFQLNRPTDGGYPGVTCVEEMAFPDLNMRKKLAENQTVRFDLPPQHARTLTFVCGMNMLKGTVVVQ